MLIEVSTVKNAEILWRKEIIASIKENPHKGNMELEKYFDAELYIINNIQRLKL